MQLGNLRDEICAQLKPFSLLSSLDHSQTALLHLEDTKEVRASSPLLLTYLGSPLVWTHHLSQKGTWSTGEQCRFSPCALGEGHLTVVPLMAQFLPVDMKHTFIGTSAVHYSLSPMFSGF